MISGSIRFTNPLTHKLEIELRFPCLEIEEFSFFIPLWRPGRYETADYSKNLSITSIENENGDKLETKRLTSNQWIADTSSSHECRISYTYFAHTMDAGNSFFDEQLIYINFINCLLGGEQLMDESITLSLDIPESYKTACALPLTQGAISASDYHELVDSPFVACSELKILSYASGEAQFKIAIQGNCPLSDEEIIADFEKFTLDQVQKMEEFPTTNYLFIIHSLDYKHYHGVEHQNSTVLVLGPNSEETKEKYREDLLGVASHELFHTWNVTRIRPKEMSPYHYHHEINFGTGIVAEGFTTYFGDWFLKTSGVFTLEEYLAELSKLCERHFGNFGRRRASLIESSHRLWLDGYKNVSPSQKVSIYVKGALSSLILDLEIRKTTNHQKNLLGVVREMHRDYTYEKGGYSWADVKKLFLNIDKSILTLAEKLAESTDPIEEYLIRTLAYAGLELQAKNHKNAITAITGLQLQDSTVTDVSQLSPLIDQVSVGDKIEAINNVAFEPNQIIDHVSELDLIRNGRQIKIETNLTKALAGLAFDIKLRPESKAPESEFRNEWIGD